MAGIKEMNRLDWGMFFTGLIMGVGILIILIIISFQFIAKDPHIECNKGNHKLVNNRCVNCGLK